MKCKHVLLPLGIALQLCAYTATARQPEQHTKHITLIENKGQVRDQHHQPRPDIQYKLSAGNGLNIFLGTGMLHYVWAKSPAAAEAEPSTGGSQPRPLQETDFYRIDVELIGANPHARILTGEPHSYYERYFQPWVNTTNSNTGVIARSYTKITYKEVYPNIDWTFHINANGQLEHDFIVHPGGRVTDIRLRYSGATALHIKPDGSLSIQSPLGHITEKAPYSYDAQGRVVPSRFVLKDSVLSFAVNAYTGTLTIDPVLEWGTYFGGSGNDECLALTADKWGYVYMTGSTASTDNIATTGAYQYTYALGTSDAFISKWNKEGRLLWSSYYGGANTDVAKGIGCDTLGNVYFGGYTNSTAGIATANAFQDALNGNMEDAFLIKLDSSGKREWGSYFGGSGNDANASFTLITDQAGHVYAAGNTVSADLPTTPGVHSRVHVSGNDIFVAKFSNLGDLVWSTFYGGPGAQENAYGLALDAVSDLYVCGLTQSASGIATSGAQQVAAGGAQEGYLAKFNVNGQLLWATYHGGPAFDVVNSVDSKDGYVVIGGATTSTTGIATANSFQAIKDNSQDGFLALYRDDGRLLWSTYYGGDKVDGIGSVKIKDDFIYLLGESTSSNNIATSGSIQEIAGGSSDAFIARFNVKGERIWGSYYGGSGAENASSLYLSDDFDLYIGGRTNSGADIATTPQALTR